MIGDKEIRQPLRHWLMDRGIDRSSMVDEVELCGGDARADLAVFHDALSGFEIKSPKDSLVRFALQMECYSKSFEYATLVADADHIASATPIVHDWWGLVAVEQRKDCVALVELRKAMPNPELDSYSVASFLWRHEVMELLKELGINKGIKSNPTRILLAKLVDSVSPRELPSMVRATIKRRENWRVASRQESGDASRLPQRKSLHRVDLRHLRTSQFANRPR
jgi:hypothetical protein